MGRTSPAGANAVRASAVRAFIGSFTSAGGRGVIATAVDPDTGALTETGASDAVADPSYLVSGAAFGGTLLYTVSETEDGAVAAFDVTGPAPRPIGGRVPVRGAAPTHLALAAGHLVTANYGSGSVSILPVGTDGAPGPVGAVLHHHGSGPDPDRQAGPHAHQVVADPTGRWVLAVDLGTDRVYVHAWDAQAGALTPHAETALRPGVGPRHLVVHPAGTHVYVVGELDPVVTVCRWDAAGGLLKTVGEHPLTPGGATRPAYPSEAVVSPDGRRLWAAVRGPDVISVLSLDRGPERPEPTAVVDCGGRWPRDLALDPAGRRLYAANERSGDVTWFDVDVDADGGIPRRAGSFAAPAASCVTFI
ncbi:lactonase family protein [Streptomyces sp. HNM0663]|uniref:Lactonase family protein n=1 Tax=Streptomyces chengmaiensis TaxID=3040919 RepID=A0ABT6HJP7_9ACTN|nr:lactonase family protein [Streptomyces chengmaiensis]MDH2388961.1 lactonase family protein [Streptomyces chengmaiensis]